MLVCVYAPVYVCKYVRVQGVKLPSVLELLTLGRHVRHITAHVQRQR